MSVLLPRRRLARAAIYTFCLFLVLIAVDLILVRIRNVVRPGYDTTRITSPTLPDGSVDYLTAAEDYFGRGVTPENNAAPLIIEALGRAALPKNQPPDGVTDRLGMAHVPEQGDHFVTYEDYCHDHSISEGNEFDADKPLQWPVTLSASTVQWVNANEKPLALIAEATRRPRFFIPWNGGYRPEMLAEILLPHVGRMRLASRAILARSVMRLEAGDISGFEDDVLTVHRMARLLDQAPTLIEKLVAMGPMETDACHVDRMAAASGKLTAEQARSLANQLESLGELTSYARDIDHGERYFVLDIMQTIAHGASDRRARIINTVLNGFRDDTGIPQWVAPFLPIPCEDTMRVANANIDGLLIASTQRTYAERISALNAWHDNIQARSQSKWLGMFSADWPDSALLPRPARLETRLTSARMECRFATIELMLAAYKADHGVFPEKLDDLSVDSTDLFADQPLTYTLHKNGYELRSVGPDLEDASTVHADFDEIFPHLAR
jgi:hypothetical protein